MTSRGYRVATVDIAGKKGYKELICSKKTAVEKYGTSFVVRAGIQQVTEGSDGNLRAVIELTDCATTLASYNSPAYRNGAETRVEYAKAHRISVEGV